MRAARNAARRLNLEFADAPLFLEWADRRIAVVHDPLDLAELSLGDCDVALHGHDHRLTLETRDGVLVFNPGECAGHMRGRNAVGVLDLAKLEAGKMTFTLPSMMP